MVNTVVKCRLSLLNYKMNEWMFNDTPAWLNYNCKVKYPAICLGRTQLPTLVEYEKMRALLCVFSNTDRRPCSTWGRKKKKNHVKKCLSIQIICAKLQWNCLIPNIQIRIWTNSVLPLFLFNQLYFQLHITLALHK